MAAPTDLSIAHAATLQHIDAIAERLGLGADDIEHYGRHKAKVRLEAGAGRAPGKLILVTAVTPTPAGEGKTTVSVGLAQALTKLGKSTALALREPSLGPCMGMKGGATGGGYSQVLPMEDINLHFTGDLHAVTAAHNLLSAIVDNNLHFGQTPRIDPRRVTWRRVLDVNDRALRNIMTGLGGRTDGQPRQAGFDITAASEVMAALCLADDLADLRARMGRFIVGYNGPREPVTAADLGANGAMTVLMREAIKPNLVQSIEGTPAFVHGGPFANIAHGTNTVVATRMAMRLADYTVTEAGFGADLGAEKYMDIVCRGAGFSPNAVVVVATVRAMKMHGGVAKDALGQPDPQAVQRGIVNLRHHVETMNRFGVPVLVVVNRFTHDTDAEVQVILDDCAAQGTAAAQADIWSQGGAGGLDAAEKVAALADGFSGTFKPLYALDEPVEAKIEKIARQAYGADGVEFTKEARRAIKRFTALGLGGLPICMAKTPASLSDDPKKIGRPEGFTITVREVVASPGAGFLVPITGSLMRMPGLPRAPAALGMDVDADGDIVGLA
jgi:formate--tetrahydrofolate ligase